MANFLVNNWLHIPGRPSNNNKLHCELACNLCVCLWVLTKLKNLTATESHQPHPLG